MSWALMIIVYTALSLWFFVSVMSHIYRKDKWYDYPILLPVLVIIYVSSAVVTVIRWVK